MKRNSLFWITLMCILFWLLLLLLLLGPKAVKAEAAAGEEEATEEEALQALPEELDITEEDLTVTAEELEEELYYDSLELLALCVEAEAGNQSLTGKRMVADVILNRVDDEAWPDDIVGVITQPYEFTTWWDGSIDAVWEPSEETFRAVQMELEERTWPDIYYFSSEGYSQYGKPWRKVGDHFFSTK